MHPSSSWTVRITVGLLLAGGTACRQGPDDPLIAAAREGDVERLEALLAAGGDPNRPDGRFTGWTPLQHAVHKRQLEAARVLLDRGARVDEHRVPGATALIMSAAYGDTPMVRLLLSRGANPRAEAPGGVTALSNASGGGFLFDITDGPALGQCHPDTVRALLEAAPDLHVPSSGAGRLSRWFGRGRGCDEVRQILAARKS